MLRELLPWNTSNIRKAFYSEFSLEISKNGARNRQGWLPRRMLNIKVSHFIIFSCCEVRYANLFVFSLNKHFFLNCLKMNQSRVDLKSEIFSFLIKFPDYSFYNFLASVAVISYEIMNLTIKKCKHTHRDNSSFSVARQSWLQTCFVAWLVCKLIWKTLGWKSGIW